MACFAGIGPVCFNKRSMILHCPVPGRIRPDGGVDGGDRRRIGVFIGTMDQQQRTKNYKDNRKQNRLLCGNF